MSTFFKRIRQQWAVYWPCTSYDEDGKPLWGDPMKVKVRWEGIIQQYTDTKGQLRVSNSEVAMPPEKELGAAPTIDGVLWQIPGTRQEQANFTVPDDVPFPTDPMKNPGASLIHLVETTPNLRARDFFVTAIL